MTTSSTVDELRAGFAEPPATSAPMMRWWWFGPDVERGEIDRELRAMAAVGLGGVEVSYVYPLSPHSERLLSPEFLARLRYAADAAHALGLRFDLTLGSGWSFGGPHISTAHAARRLHWERREIGPGPAQIPVVAPWPGDELIAAYVGSGSQQEPPEELTLLTVAASPTGGVDRAILVPDGTGTRQVLLAYAQLTGQNVKRAAYGAEGPVLDHYSATAARQHLHSFGDPLLDAVPAELVGSVFCDSLEVYGADWTPQLLSEFEARRGYDPLPELYRLVVDGPDAARLRADYHRTLTELYEDNFVAVCRGWAAERGVAFRIQGYGAPPAMVSSYRGADLFEGEGWGWTELTQTRWATSAAHLFGQRVVSSETWTWVHSPSFRATPLDLKGEAHEHLLAGINQLIGHGWPYSPADAPGLGWFFYAAAALDDRNPWWPAMPSLVRYLTRLCWLLRQGDPVADVLVYVPGDDVFTRMGTAVGGSLDAWRETRGIVGDDVIEVIRTGGWDYDLFDDGALDVLEPDGSRAVIISGATTLPPATRAWLEQLISVGGTVLTVSSAVELPGAMAVDLTDVATALAAALAPAVRLDPPTPDVGVVHRRVGDADVYLVVNTGPAVRELSWAPRVARGRYEVWDAETGEVSAPDVARLAGHDHGVRLRLHPYHATVVVAIDEGAAPSPTPPAPVGHPQRIPLTDGWQVQFADRETSSEVVLPHQWEDEPDRAAFSGAATYRSTVELPGPGSPSRVVLDFGEAPAVASGPDEHDSIRGHSYRADVDPPVGVVAAVRVNDTDCGVVWAPPYVLDVSRAVRPGPNRIEITVCNTAANALAHDQHLGARVADSERRYGRRFRMQELDRAMIGVRSGLLSVPTLTFTHPPDTQTPDTTLGPTRAESRPT